MNSNEARDQVDNTFNYPFHEGKFRSFSKNLLKDLDESKEQTFSGAYIKDAFKSHIISYKRLGSYLDIDGETLDVLTVKLKDFRKLDSARTMQRNFIADYLKTRGEKEAAIVAFYNENYGDWRFSYVRMEYKVEMSNKGQIKVKEELTPARRYSFLVGENEPNHTAQQQISPLLEYNKKLSLSEIEEAFNIESVTREFFNKYKDLFLKLKDEIDDIIGKDSTIAEDFATHDISTANFAKKLMGQIVFLYFVQKKGWMGVPVNANWGNGDRRFLRTLFEKCKSEGKNFFNDYLEHLFYDALNNENRGTADPSYHPIFKCRIPFLNGGLFEPMNDYDWKNTELRIENNILAEILDAFDLYNFTVREDEPLEKEVAVDPEMLGKVFENLLEVTDRKSKGAFYTPREIVHYMCQESLIDYLDTRMNSESESMPKSDLEKFIRNGDRYYEYAVAIRDFGTKKYQESDGFQLPETIRNHVAKIDQLLNDIKVCDPAIGSGAFPVGMMNEIVRARMTLTVWANSKDSDRTRYNFKRLCILESIYGVDIDPGAIDIAKLRLWLSLVVDEEDFNNIQPLPNLDYKIMQGDSLLNVDMNNLFVDEALGRIEILKNEYFDATDRDKKQELHQQIDEILLELTGHENCFDFKIHFSEVFKQNRGFDIVIGNPPYIQLQNNGGELAKLYEKKAYVTYARTGDIYALFYEMGVNNLNDKGNLCLITSNKWMRAKYGESLRKFLSQKTPVKLIDLGAGIFDTATVDTNILIVKNNTTQKPALKAITLKERFSVNDLKEENFSIMTNLTEGSWVILSPIEQKIKEKIEKIGTPLKDWDIKINYGIKTGYNEAFIIDAETKDKLIKQDPRSAEIIRPILRGRDIKNIKLNLQISI